MSYGLSLAWSLKGRGAGVGCVSVWAAGCDGVSASHHGLVIEFTQRQNLGPVDEARAYREMMQMQGLSATEVAARVHKTEQHVRGRLRLLRYDDLCTAVEENRIAVSVVREIMKLSKEGVDVACRALAEGQRLEMKDVATIRAQVGREPQHQSSRR